MSGTLFSTDAVTKRYGGLTAVAQVSLDLDPGELVGLIGPNGAGKTTLFNLITGADSCTEGRVHFGGQDVTKLRGYQRARLAWRARSRTSASGRSCRCSTTYAPSTRASAGTVR